VIDVALTPREADVLARLVAGLSNRAIALDLGISENTAKVHVMRLLERTGCGSRLQLGLQAQRQIALDHLRAEGFQRAADSLAAHLDQIGSNA
jgi:DNA-binding NarL/FixJ family response regulator